MKRMKLPLLYILSVLLSVLPVLIYFIVNYDRYIRSVPEGIKLLFGAIFVIAILIIKALGFLKIKSSIAFFAGLLILSYLLESIISDIVVFSLLALVGEILSAVVRIFIRKEREKKSYQKTESAVKSAIESISGRV